jgi:protein-tyrosine-phosphatase
MRKAWQASEASAHLDLEFASAGARAMAGMPRCEKSQTLVGQTYGSLSQELPADLNDYDVILTMERSHRGPIVVGSPSVRSRVFTLVEAAQLAAFITGPGLVLDVATGAEPAEDADFDLESVPALPAESSQRLQWFISELDAWRGQVPLDLQNDTLAVVDIPDPHDYQQDVHEKSFAQIDQAIEVFIMARTGVMSR